MSLVAAEAPHGVSEHKARTARGVRKAVAAALSTIWNHRACLAFDALVVLCLEHVRTIHRRGFTKQNVREFLFEHTGVPVRRYRDEEPGEGVEEQGLHEEIDVDGEPYYWKFRSPEPIALVVAGGNAGKFSAVLGSWATGARGSQMVTYPV